MRVRAIAEKYDLPYTSGSLPVQYAKSWRTIFKLSVPNEYLVATADDAPETASERKFAGQAITVVDPATGRRRGLVTAIAEGKRRGPLAMWREQRRRRRNGGLHSVVPIRRSADARETARSA